MKKLVLSIALLMVLPAAQAQENQQDKIAEESLNSLATALLADNKELQDEFAKVRANLPKSLKLAKEYRACLQGADNKDQAAACHKNIKTRAAEIGLEDDELDDDLASHITEWTDKEKADNLKEMDEFIGIAEKMLPCTQEAKNPLEMMMCMQLLEKQQKE